MQSTIGMGLDNIGSALSWNTVEAIIKHLPLTSALAREVNNDSTTWGSTLKTNFLLADVIDLLQAIDFHLIKLAGGKAQKPKPYPRPKVKQEKDNRKHYGKGAMKLDDLKKWIFRKQ